MPNVLVILQSAPIFRSAPEQSGDIDRVFWCDGFALCQDVIQPLARDSELARDFLPGFSDSGKHILSKQSARMRRAYVRIGFHLGLLVVLLEINSLGVAVSEFERDAKWSNYHFAFQPFGIAYAFSSRRNSGNREYRKLEKSLRVQDMENHLRAAVTRINSPAGELPWKCRPRTRGR